MMRLTSAKCIAWPGFLRDHVAQQRPSDQSQIADQVQSLVTAAFVGEAQALGIEDAAAVEAHGVFERCAADQPHVAHLRQFILESEGARGRDFIARSAPG